METAKLLIDGYFDRRTADNYHLTVDDLLDFPKEDEIMNDAFFAGNSSNSYSSNLSVSGSEQQFSGNFTSSDNHFSSKLCIPYDDLGDLDWIPNFSTDDFHSLEAITGADTSSSETGHEIHDSATAHASVYGPSYVPVPTKSRSKISRAAPREWSSRLQVFSPASTASAVAATKRDTGGAPVRKCLHCGSEKTPQWRAGPMGPKTLCNACGVRYNSGRLVPEYRPAASPTFVPEKHSNSHRKVVEIRRQMEERRYQRRQ